MHIVASRRAITAMLVPLLTPLPMSAFDNARSDVPQDASLKVNPGPRPGGLGLQKRLGDLGPCADGKPHCFSSTTRVGENAVDTKKIGRDWIVPPFTYDAKTISVAGAMLDLKKAVLAYPPGQNDIDAGGFKVVSVKLPNDPNDVGYLYVQFESAGGYIDDVEFAALDGIVNVRTSSRVGYADFGVNAKRFNWLAKKLGSFKGWKTSLIKKQDHLEYFELNDLNGDRDVGL